MDQFSRNRSEPSPGNLPVSVKHVKTLPFLFVENWNISVRARRMKGNHSPLCMAFTSGSLVNISQVCCGAWPGKSLDQGRSYQHLWYFMWRAHFERYQNFQVKINPVPVVYLRSFYRYLLSNNPVCYKPYETQHV